MDEFAGVFAFIAFGYVLYKVESFWENRYGVDFDGKQPYGFLRTIVSMFIAMTVGYTVYGFLRGVG